jgi:hypothetical protein
MFQMWQTSFLSCSMTKKAPTLFSGMLHPNTGGESNPQNVGENVPDYTAQHTRRQPPSITPRDTHTGVKNGDSI